MLRSALFMTILTLTACVSADSSPAPVGEVRVEGKTYQITPLDPAGKRWKVIVDGEAVICSKPDERSCYWSVRHHLKAQDLLDDLGQN